MTQQGLRQASVRAVTGTTLPYNGDWHALFDAAGIASGPFNGRLLAWINDRLGATYTELDGAMNAFAVAQGFASWNAMGTFDAGGFTGILDELSATTLGAWSVSRVLKTDWLEGNLIRLRRASDNVESDFGADDNGNLDTAAIATWIGASSAFVVKIYDQSGNGNDIVQATAGTQPKFTASAGPNGQPAAFDDNTRSATMTIPAAAPVTGMFATGGSAYWGLKVGSSVSLRLTTQTQTGAGTEALRMLQSEGAAAGFVRLGFVYGWSGTAFNQALWLGANSQTPINSDCVAGFEYSAASTTNDPAIYYNGTATTVTESRAPSGTAGTDGGSATTIFSSAPDDTYLSEVIFLDGVLSSGDRTLLNDSMVARYVA